MILRRTAVLAAMLIALTLCATNAAKATLLAYEGFNYPDGTPISGQSGGFGWAGAWATGSAGNLLGTNVAAGLSYTDLAGQSLMTTNGSLVVGNPAGPTSTTATPNRTLSSTLVRGHLLDQLSLPAAEFQSGDAAVFAAGQSGPVCGQRRKRGYRRAEHQRHGQQCFFRLGQRDYAQRQCALFKHPIVPSAPALLILS